MKMSVGKNEKVSLDKYQNLFISPRKINDFKKVKFSNEQKIYIEGISTFFMDLCDKKVT